VEPDLHPLDYATPSDEPLIIILTCCAWTITRGLQPHERQPAR